jgi:hypothetical protein
VTKHASTIPIAVEDSPSSEVVSVAGVVTGILAGFADDGAPLLDIPSISVSVRIAGRSCIPLRDEDVGKQIVAVPDAANPDSPIVIGVIQPLKGKRDVEIVADDAGIIVHATESITLQCGEASIRLGRDGTVVIRGRHVVTHAAGVNRIRGGSVELN